MQRTRPLFAALALALGWVLACSGGADDPSEPVEAAAPEAVAAHSSGTVSATAPLRVQFARAIEGVEAGSPAPDVFTLAPSVPGTVTWASDRELVFTPGEPLPSGRGITVHVALSTIDPAWSDFGFVVEVIEQTLWTEGRGLSAEDETGATQRYEGSVLASDSAEADAIEKALEVRWQGSTLTPTWTHSSDGRDHAFVVSGLARAEDAPRELVLALSGEPLGLDLSLEETVTVPALSQFAATEARAVTGAERYVELRFTDPIADQSLDGLVTVSGKRDLRFAIDGSVVRVYSTSGFSGQATVEVRDLKNAAGRKLGQPQTLSVSFEPIKPGVRFVGSGVILPPTDRLVLPIEVANLSAVTITARQVFDDNIPQFLQDNSLEGDQNLTRVGRPVWRQRVPLKASASGANRWARVGLDLSELVAEHPGGMYRLDVDFTRADIVWDCPTAGPEPMPLPPLDEDWDGGSSESSYWDAWDDGLASWEQYRNREDPCTRGYYRTYYDHDITAGRNVLITDVGLMAKMGEDGRLVALVTDLMTAMPEQGIEVEVLDYQQQRLASATTGADGSVVFAALDRKPFVVHAIDGEHHAWVKLDKGSANTVSHFDVGGTRVEEGLKGTFFTERGVWRPGDDIHLTFVLFDTTGELPDDHPVQFELVGPTGNRVEHRVVHDHVDRFYTLTTRTDADAPTGPYTARVRVGGRTFERTLRVESIVPNRLKIELDYGTDRIRAPELKLAGTLSSRWLHGAKAPGLRTSVQMKLTPTKTTFAGFDDYTFDDPASSFASEPVDLFEGTLDDEGKVAIDERLYVPDGAPGMLRATFTTRVFEPSGAASIDQGSIEVSPHERYLGLKTPKGDAARGMLLTDVDHPVEIVAVDGDGKLAGDGEVEVSLYKVRWRWWWESGSESLADYVGSDSVQPIDKEIVRLKGGKATYSMRIEYPAWGRYLLVARDRKGTHTTGKTLYIDWPGWAGRNQKDNPGGASVLSVTTADKEVEVGEDVTLHIPTAAGGRALVSLETGTRVLRTEWVEPEGDTTRYTFRATPDMAPSVYAHVTLVQPHSGGGNDLPLRLYGVVPVEVVDPATRLEPTVATADVFEPESTVEVTVAEAKGKAMTYTLAVVDEGLLGLTRFQTPDLWGDFYQREALGVRTWDTFSLVAGALGGSLEELISIGGDGEGADAPPAKANRFPPVVRVLGPFELEAGAEARHEVELPPYIGEVRVMVVAGHDGAYGSTSKPVPVRKPLMLLATLPRVLSPQETLELPVSVFAMEEKVRDVTVSVTAEGPVELGKDRSRSLRFTQPGDQLVTFPVTVADAVGIARVTIVAEGAGERSEQVIEIDVRHPGLPEQRTVAGTVPPGEAWLAAVDLFGVTGSNEAVLEVSRTPPLDLDRRLDELVRYPHGCVEQTTSGAFPQVYLTTLVDLDDPRRREVQRNVEAGIQRLRAFQQGGGGFGYWPGAYDTHTWATTYVGHFLLEAERAGYLVPADMKQAWIAHQTKQANRFTGAGDRSDLEQAYRLYTLALAGKPALGAMNRLKEARTLSDDARWRLAGAYQLAGQADVATALLKGAAFRFEGERELGGTYGSRLRDRAMALETLVLVEPGSDRTRTLASEVSDGLVDPGWLSTQETAFALVAMARFAQSDGGGPLELRWRLGDAPAETVTTDRPVVQVPLPVTEGSPRLEVTSSAGQPLYTRLVTRGLPRLDATVARDQGLAMTVEYVQADPYQVLSADDLDQGVDFIARVTVKNLRGRKLEELALSQVVPSGWEIHGTAPGKGDGYEYRDVRDDRVLTYFDLDKGAERTFTIGLNASYKGRYYLPPVVVEAMYDASITARSAGTWVTVEEPGPRG